MDPLSKLPMECLKHILQIIADWDHKSTATLAALLMTNKHIFAATVPYLYSDAFKTKLGHNRGPDHIHRQSFIRLLLGRIPINILPMIVSLEFGFNTTTGYPGSHAVANPIMDYIAYIQHLNLDMSDTNPRPIVYEEFPGQYRWLTGRPPLFPTSTPIPAPFPQPPPFSPLPPPFTATGLYPQLYTPSPPPPSLCAVLPPPWLLTEDEFISLHSRTVGEGPLEPHYSAYNEIFGSDARSKFHKTILYYEVCWSITNPILEQLKSLTIPLVDVWRYLDSVRRLGQLECVRFNLDQSFSRDFNNNTVRDRADRATQAMVLFVKEHKRLFKDRLKIVHVNDVGMWGCGSYQCPPEIQLEIIKLVPREVNETQFQESTDRW